MDKNTIVIIIIMLILLGGIYYIFLRPVDTNDYTALAQCIKASGAEFFGTFWCPHCNNQKKMFGKAAGELPYIECSTEDGHGQLPVCKDNNIEVYPTWVFADGTRQSGEVSLRKLADKTGCTLPL